jgi:DNA-binding transcriptional ArsR family regulator
MTNDDFTPLPTMPLSADEQIRAYIHPARMTILEHLGREKHSVSGVARLLGVHPANLTHHFKLLEKTGLIKLVEKRDTGKNLEKYYRAVACHFTVSLVEEPLVNKKALALSILRDNLAAAIQALKTQEDDQAVFGVLQTLHLGAEDIVQFQQKMAQLLDDFSANTAETGASYTLNISFYPGETGQQTAQEIVIGEEE